MAKSKREARTEGGEKKTNGKKRILIGLCAALILGAAAFFAVTRVIVPNSRYSAAGKLMEEGKYDEAKAAFEALDGYKDSADRAKDAAYQAAAKLCEDGKYDEAKAAFEALGCYGDSADQAQECVYRKQRAAFSDPAVGDVIRFGFYEQDNDTANGKEEIEWRVLAVDGSKALLISKYALDCQPFNESFTGITWEECTLREWLNGTFCSEAFGSAHQKRIVETAVPADENPEFLLSPPGNDTVDRVFLLSVPEAHEYFDSDEARQCVPTPYALARGMDTYDDVMLEGRAACWWWLRTPGINVISAALVFHDGAVFNSGNGVGRKCNAVRPALWVDLG